VEGWDVRVTPWSVSPAEWAPSAPLERKAKFLLRWALLAPSSHNSQPWLFHVREGTIRIYADADRWLRVCDPEQRELHLSLGCALENLLVAGEYFGFGHEVRYASRDSAEGAAAIVTLHPGGSTSRMRGLELFDAIRLRRTNHRPYDPTPVPAQTLDRLRRACADPDIGLVLTADVEARVAAQELLACAEAEQFADHAFREELGRWIGQGAFGTPWLLAKLEQMALTYLAFGHSTARRDARILASSPVFGVLWARRHDRSTWLRAGQLFERLYLVATMHGLSLQPVSPIVQVPSTRDALASMLPGPGAIPLQTFRLGFAESERTLTPRRPLEEVLL
jgi:nitroreductase